MAWRIIFILFLILLIDLYFFQAIKTVLGGTSDKKRSIIYGIYWGITVITFLFILTASIYSPAEWPKHIRIYAISFLFIIAISKFFGIIFLLIDDIARIFRWISGLVFSSAESSSVQNISRLKFLNYTAIVLAALPFSTFLYGMIKGAFDYTIRKVTIPIPDLPASFEGLKIVQISDLHTGSFVSGKPLKRAVELINDQNPDIVFFTGDLVNDIADEALPFIDILKEIKAPLGVFSVLGNHDYGDYVRWDSMEAKTGNMEKMKRIHKQMGWKLLLNENHILEKNKEKLAIIGVENWGAALRFPKYGKLNLAVKGTEGVPVKLLLSHDPSHWEGEILPEFPDINATFSGHTHGMQFGIEIPGIKWSPVQYFYKQWAGLYQNKHQSIYVNRGLGFIGYSGRVGIMPEISVHTLSNQPA